MRWPDRRLLVLVGALLACSDEAPVPAEPIASAEPIAPADAIGADLSGPAEVAGARIYAQLECAGCHESAAVPGLIVTPLEALAARYDEDSLAALLAAPKPPMPLYGMSDPERRALASYLLERFN